MATRIHFRMTKKIFSCSLKLSIQIVSHQCDLASTNELSILFISSHLQMQCQKYKVDSCCRFSLYHSLLVNCFIRYLFSIIGKFKYLKTVMDRTDFCVRFQTIVRHYLNNHYYICKDYLINISKYHRC